MPRHDALARCRAAFDQLMDETGRVPTKAAVARAAGTTTETVGRHWDEVTGKPNPLRPRQIVAPGRRRCLSCSTLFASGWAGHRICERCKRLDAWRSGDIEYSARF